jgi:hypothetical protein
VQEKKHGKLLEKENDEGRAAALVQARSGKVKFKGTGIAR